MINQIKSKGKFAMQKMLFFIIALLILSVGVYSQDTFAEWDQNGDGKITIEEFPGGYGNIEYFNQIDTNRDKIITPRELNIFLGIEVPKPKPKKPHHHRKRHRLRAKIQKLEQKIHTMKKESQKRKKQLKQALKKLKQVVAELTKERKRNARSLFHPDQEKKIKKENTHLRAHIEKLKKHIHKLAQIQNHNSRFQKEIHQLRNSNAKLLAEIKNLKYKLTHVSNPNNRLQKEIYRLRNNNANFVAEIKMLKNKLAKARLFPVKKPVIIKPIKPIKPQRPKRPVHPIKVHKKYVFNPHIPKPSKTHAQDMLMAEEAARVNALRNLAIKIRGSWVAACSKNVDGRNKLLIVGQLDPTKLFGVEELDTNYDFINGKAKAALQITRANIIESIRRTNTKMTPDEYQEIRFMFPEKVKAYGYGAWTSKAQKKLMALYGAQLDARRKLVEQLRGVMIKSSTRMENFVVQKHQVIVTIESTLLIGVKIVEEKIISGAIAQAKISIDRAMFIYSIRKGMESNGVKMTPSEYQNLRNMLNKSIYQFVGKAAIK